MSKTYKFAVTGEFDISSALQELIAHDEGVIGFTLPDGKVARLCIALEVEDEKGEMTYITSESEMNSIGFADLDYDALDFMGASNL